MAKVTYAEWLKELEKLEREQREHYAAGHEDKGDAVGERIKQWICNGRGLGFCAPGGRPIPL